ncbi:MAG: hypothetical protein R3A13_07750 [Bdellovibrionota bacterium]
MYNKIFKSFLILSLLLALGVSLTSAEILKVDAPAASISSFEECVAAGNRALKSYPGRCYLPDGTMFTQKIDNQKFEAFKTESIKTVQPPKASPNSSIENSTNTDSACVNKCGDGECQEMVCMAVGCPCAETAESCKEDCQ